MSVAQVRKEVEPQGFVLKETHDFLPWQHVLVFVKDKEPEVGKPKGEATPGKPGAHNRFFAGQFPS